MKSIPILDYRDYNSIAMTDTANSDATMLRNGCRMPSPEFRTGTASNGLPPPGRKSGPSDSSVFSGWVSSTVEGGGVVVAVGVAVDVGDVLSEKVGRIVEVEIEVIDVISVVEGCAKDDDVVVAEMKVVSGVCVVGRLVGVVSGNVVVS